MARKAENILVSILTIIIVLLFVNSALVSAANPQAPEGQKVSIFKDVSNNDPNLAFINYLTSKSIIKGFSDGTFHPAESLTRAQAAVLMIKAGDIKTDPSLNVPFNDVQTDYWARDSIGAAVKAGYISGFPDKSFRPEEKLTRAQAAAMVLRLSKQKLSEINDTKLSDVSSSHWAASSIAEVVAAGMMQTSSDGKQFYPDQAVTRGDIARALSVLLTEDPDLYKTELVGTVQVKSGTVSIQKDQQKPIIITGSYTVVAGDTISTDANGEAAISFNDGSGLLLKANTLLKIEEASGRSYIKMTGDPGTAVDWLKLDLKQGRLFGALPDKQIDEEQSSTRTPNTSYLAPSKSTLLASLNGFQLLGDATGTANTSPWYKTSKAKKVKVKVDMPWGVAEVRGCFWASMVGGQGQSTSVLEGGAGDVSVSSAGQTVSLNPGQSSTTPPVFNAPPAPPVPMAPVEQQAWLQAQTWIQQQAQQLQQNAPTGLPGTVIQNQADILSRINNIIQEIQGILTPQVSTGSGSSGSSADTTAPTMTSLTATVDGEKIQASNGALTVGQNSVTREIKVLLSEPVTLVGTPVVKINIAGTDYDYGTIALDSEDTTNKTLLITPSGTNGTVGSSGTFTFTLAAGSLKDAAGNKNALITFSMTVADQTAPTMIKLTATVGDADVESVDNTLTVAQGSETTAIRVLMSEPVTLVGTPVVTMTLLDGDHDYGEITLDPEDTTNRTLLITPNGSNGTAGLVGTFIFTVAAGSVKDAAGNGSALTTFNLTVLPGLPQVENVGWDGDIHWSSVDNQYAQYCAGYVVKLYRNGVSVGGAGTVSVNDPTAHSYDYSSAILATGPGIYTVTVKAIGDHETYADGPVSEASATKLVTTGVELNPTTENIAGGTSPVNQVVELQVITKPDTDGNITIDGEDVAVLATDADAAAIAKKIADHPFTNWTVTVSAQATDTVVFTAKTATENTEIVTDVHSTHAVLGSPITTTYGGDKEIGTTKIYSGAYGSSGMLKVCVNDGNLNRSLEVAVTVNDNATAVAGKIRAVLAADTGTGGVAYTGVGGYRVSGTDADIILTQNVASPSSNVDLQVYLNPTIQINADSQYAASIVGIRYYGEGYGNGINMSSILTVDNLKKAIEPTDGSTQKYTVIDHSTGSVKSEGEIKSGDQLVVIDENGITLTVYGISYMY